MKVVDFDMLFEEYVNAFLQKTKGKYSEEELEDAQPKLFDKFSALKIKNIGNITVDEYYYQNRDKLIDILKAHLRNGVTVDDFLIKHLSTDVSEDELIDNLNEQFDGEYLFYIIKALNLKGSKKAFNRYIDLLFYKNTETDVASFIIEILSEYADDIYKSVLDYKAESDFDGIKAEVISNVSFPKAEVTEFLKCALLAHRDRIPEFLSYIVKYDDESLLDTLYTLLKSEEISYVDYKELKIAVEALGGECKEERDFSYDSSYKILKGES